MNDDLKAVNYFKEFETKHKELKDEFRRVSNDILFLISRLEKLNSELRRLPEKVEQDNSEIFQSFNEVIEKRNEARTCFTSPRLVFDLLSTFYRLFPNSHTYLFAITPTHTSSKMW